MAAQTAIILASGAGSNAEAILKFAQDNQSLLKIVALLSDKRECGAFERAKRFGVQTKYVSAKEPELLAKEIRELQPDWAFLAGYMRIVKESFLKCFWDIDRKYYRVMNIHPSLLPAYPGLHAYEKAYESGDSKSGITVHLVDERMDHGPIIAQESFEKNEADTLEEFIERGRALETPLYVEAVRSAVLGEIHIEETSSAGKQVFLKKESQ